MVNIADPLAYCAHDLEDALNAGYLQYEEIEQYENSLVQRVIEECRRRYPGYRKGDKIIKARLIVRTLIETTNVLVIEETNRNASRFRIESVEGARKTSVDIVSCPVRDLEDFNRLKQFLFERVYKSPQVCIMNEKGKMILSRMFEHLEKRPEMLPRNFKSRFDRAPDEGGKKRVIGDYISGMTDRYAMDMYQMMFEPYEKVMFEFRG